MVALPVITTLCTLGVAFYLRFLLAIGKELKPGLIGLARRFQFQLDRNFTTELLRRKPVKARDVLRVVNLEPNTLEVLRKDVN
jgi:hypothetical protein